jgi:hypothetical protein
MTEKLVNVKKQNGMTRRMTEKLVNVKNKQTSGKSNKSSIFTKHINDLSVAGTTPHGNI